MTPIKKLIEKLAKKYAAVLPALGERGRRLWAGAEADAIGRGGVAWLAEATGLAISTVRKGRDEVRGHAKPNLVRERAPGGGRIRLEKRDPHLAARLDSLVSPSTRGDPENPLRWTCKSLRVLAQELGISPNKVGQLLRHAGYSLQANTKTREGSSHPDRNVQFEFINAKSKDFIARGLPVISVDAKKKELVGEHANAGREWQPQGRAVEVLSHDFVRADSPRAIPYGIYDVAKNVGFVNVGTDHNTPTFAVRSIERWWEQMGALRYPSAKELFITADAGGSNASRSRVWKVKLQDLSDSTGLIIHVSHYPPGTSKWNKIEHRLFSFITINWRGHPLTTYETIVQLIGGTRTSKGLSVTAELDSQLYPVGIAASNETLNHLSLERAAFRGEWNYTLRPRTAEQSEVAVTVAAKTTVKPLGTRVELNARWMTLFSEQQRSGLNHSEFYRAKGLTGSAYYGARKRLLGPLGAPTAATRLAPAVLTNWLKLFSEHEQSGLSQRAFCRARGINFFTFYGKRRRLIGRPIQSRKRTAK
jgi:hypothetical protein